jgi:hypothetical protein
MRVMSVLLGGMFPPLGEATAGRRLAHGGGQRVQRGAAGASCGTRPAGGIAEAVAYCLTNVSAWPPLWQLARPVPVS